MSIINSSPGLDRHIRRKKVENKRPLSRSFFPFQITQNIPKNNNTDLNREGSKPECAGSYKIQAPESETQNTKIIIRTCFGMDKIRNNESAGIKKGESSLLEKDRMQEPANIRTPNVSLNAGERLPKKEKPPEEIIPARVRETRSKMNSADVPSQKESAHNEAGKSKKPRLGLRLLEEWNWENAIVRQSTKEPENGNP
ncbi:hypothetical protein [Leptospira licerasiae]|uniref:hypothetical protein n=1 Tax=Leptospira licerasiae TaxID=447106 RepID=UPI0030166AA3